MACNSINTKYLLRKYIATNYLIRVCCTLLLSNEKYLSLFFIFIYFFAVNKSKYDFALFQNVLVLYYLPAMFYLALENY